ncbi:penicillin-binding protein 2 [Sphingomonas sp.]|uniref:peptidoglycan D,D-transpeptidase FtsI family protein n=1 Tax=Sphingomonas sp. TaxID=28214 RepID=UPI0025F5E04F|nr:penicillin-binding protein 2 [Sphingomonas sp.]
MTTLVAQPPRIRHQDQRQASLVVAHQRLMMLMLLFAAVIVLIAGRLVWLSVVRDAKAAAGVSSLLPNRGDIVDRNGEVLARTIDAWSIGVHTNKLLNDPEDVAAKLAALMPERSEAQYLAILKSGVRFTYLRRRAMPDLVAQVNAIGEPAMAYAREPERLYPQTTLAAHVLGYTDFDGRGVSGMERVLNDRLSNAHTRANPVALAIDARVQAIMESEMSAAMIDQQAKGATGVVLDVHTGEVIAMVSLPVYNPNKPGEGPDEARRNNVTQSVYELGSTFKPLTVANALDSGVVPSLSKRYDATAPLQVGKYKIHDEHSAGRWLNVIETLILSSNIVTARIADELGEARTKSLFHKLHFDTAPDIELKERGRPIWPAYWGRTTVMTIGYGHGMAVTPLHLATAYAALVNGGIFRPSTLLKIAPGKAPQGSRVFSQATSDKMRQMLRMIVLDGTGRKADVDGLRVGGKTGTGDKAAGGGYNRHLTVSTFAAAFPMDAPKYVVVTMLDEPKGSAASAGQRTAGWVVAPATNKIISRIGPLLGIMPDSGKDIDISALVPLVWKAKGEN